MIQLTRWQPDASVWPAVGRLFGLRNELERLLDHPLVELSGSPRRFWSPALDVFEDKDNYFVKAEIAGVKKEDIDVSLEDGELTISGERKGDESVTQNGSIRAERFAGRFERTITLPAEVKADQVAANYKDGILTVTLPKAEAVKPKQIEVKVN